MPFSNSSFIITSIDYFKIEVFIISEFSKVFVDLFWKWSRVIMIGWMVFGGNLSPLNY